MKHKILEYFEIQMCFLILAKQKTKNKTKKQKIKQNKKQKAKQNKKNNRNSIE